MGMGMGMGLLPMMYAMNPTASLSPTDAAALGTQGQGTGSLGPNGMNGIFRNPMAAPLLYSSLYPMIGNQTGALMLANQAGMMGIGSGQLSGVRPGTGSIARPVCTADRRQAAWHCVAAGGIGGPLLQPHRDRQSLSSKLLQPAESLLSASCPLRRIRLFSI